MAYEGSIVERKLVKIWNCFPVKIYRFKSHIDTLGAERKVEDLVRETIDNNREVADIRKYVFGIAFPYGYLDGEEPVEGIDIFPARLRDGWEGNPMYDSWTFENGVYVPREKGTTCGTGLIILGKEEELRREKPSLKEYIEDWPIDIMIFGRVNI